MCTSATPGTLQFQQFVIQEFSELYKPARKIGTSVQGLISAQGYSSSTEQLKVLGARHY